LLLARLTGALAVIACLVASSPSAAAVPDDWAFRPASRPPVPQVPHQYATWARNPIDAFVLEKQLAAGLSPSPEADRRTLIRRLTFDLIGLPPAPEEVRAFLDDASPDAYEKLVDRLLASPAYGERWARHWLDVVHFGETHGYDKDKLRPNAWPYRDYVIRSFNDDKSYSRFVREQLAGDALLPRTADGIIATGFIAAGPWDFVGHMELREGTVDKEITRSLDRDDMVMTAASTFLSLTVHCARCHDHKFDPITQEDYYRMQAVFAGVDRGERHFEDPALPKQTRPVYAAVPLDEPRPIHLLARGDVKQPRQPVGPGTVRSLCASEQAASFQLPQGAPESSRRRALAEWLTAPSNLLARRSIVNRVWQYHFGRGLVDTPNDFGKMGSRPTHPELLDYLAYRFVDEGESLKSLHRLILTSSTYRQASGPDPAKEKVDADNRLLWRQNRTRLDAECVHDAVLAVSGRLDRTMYGPSVRQFLFKDDHSPVYDYAKYDPASPGADRRSIYRFLVRSVPDPLMDTLDCPDASLLSPRRNTTLTALQALSLLNNPFMTGGAERLAGRVEGDHPHDLSAQVREAFVLATTRPPTADELDTLTGYAARHGLPNACRVILNSNEFVFVD
jgi:hypothetical protein